jgi:competence protein ComFB
MEGAVVEELESLLEKLPGLCKCERCREDMVCWALNQLPPKYVATELGGFYTKLHQMKAQAKADITVKLVQAAKIVKANPRH